MNSNTPAAEQTVRNAVEEVASVTSEAFRWLLILGFPPSVAAASVMPQIFRCDDDLAPKAA